MATVQINNTLPINLEGGGQLIINNGTDDLVLNLHERGSVRIVPGGYNLGRYTNYGTPRTPILGDSLRSRVNFRVMATTEFPTDDKLVDLSGEVNAAAGIAKLLTVKLKIPNFKDASAGTLVTLGECYFTKPVEYEEGSGEFDFLVGEMESNLRIWTLATY